MQTFTCWRCGFQWQRPAVSGQRPRWCAECRPLVRNELKLASYHRLHPRRVRPRKRAAPSNRERSIIRWRTSLLEAGYGRALHITDQQWVDRWHERPDLFLRLVMGLERSVARYPDWQAALDDRRAA